MSSERTVRLRIEGRVQGVGFRAWLAHRATGLGLAGFVRNRRDGGVEAVATGEAGAVESLIEACHRGPGPAAVAFVKVLDEPPFDGRGFEVWPTA